jgi:hypothetical protein
VLLITNQESDLDPSLAHAFVDYEVRCLFPVARSSFTVSFMEDQSHLEKFLLEFPASILMCIRSFAPNPAYPVYVHADKKVTTYIDV